MKNKRVTYICVVWILGCIGLVYAAGLYEISFTNNFQTGIVDIDIEQYQMTPDGEMAAVPGEVMPNQDVSYIPRVRNLEADAYVRVKVDIMMDKEVPVPITLDSVYGINPDWVQRGEYFYLTKALRTGETSDLFTGFHVPEEWENETAGSFRIKVSADAVQELNFEPDFGALLPWGSIEIQKAKQERNISYNVAKEKGEQYRFTYTSDNGLESETGDLFSNFGSFMAGDTFEDVLEMKNASGRDVKLYFRTEATDSDLIKMMKLVISCDGKTVYEGDLASEEIATWHELTVVERGKLKKLQFEVSLPDESDNFYTVLKDEVVWKFKCTETEQVVQTGDNGNMTVFCMAACLAVLVILLTVLTGRKGKRK